MFNYEYFDALCKERGVTASQVSRETGVASATLSSWKKGEYIPKPPKLQKIADYFNVPLQYLITGNIPSTNEGTPPYDVPRYSDDIMFIIEAVKGWTPDQQKRLRKYVEDVNRIIGGDA